MLGKKKCSYLYELTVLGKFSSHMNVFGCPSPVPAKEACCDFSAFFMQLVFKRLRC